MTAKEKRKLRSLLRAVRKNVAKLAKDISRATTEQTIRCINGKLSGGSHDRH